MKKIEHGKQLEQRRLRLASETIRKLTTMELAGIRGGESTRITCNGGTTTEVSLMSDCTVVMSEANPC